MITLSLPPSDGNWFFIYKDCRFGPIIPIGSPGWQTNNVILDLDSLAQKRGAYSENTVSHTKFEGEVFYDPFIGDCSSSPTTAYPNQISWATYGQYGKKTTVPVGCGAYSPRHVAMVKTGPSVGWHHIAYEFTGDVDVTIWDVFAQPVNLNIMGYGYSKYHMRLCLDRVKSKDVLNNITTYYIDEDSWVVGYNTHNHYGSETGLDWMDKVRSFDEICSLVDSALGEATFNTTQSNFVSARRTWSAVSGPTGSVVTYLNQSIVPQLIWEKTKVYPLGEEDYGELVLQASASFRANKTNMLEFLKDIRNPQEMIPKLKNLNKLRGIADNYLTAHYGLLPTISDLQSIWNAITKLKAHRDKYGFKTSSFGSRASGEWDGKPYTIEQHAKIAICDGDSGFLSLIDGLDSAGVFPSLSNLWDMVPYSFLVDWFVNVGDFLERVDTRLRLERYDIRYVTLSRKQYCTVTFVASLQNPYYGSVVRSLYQRWTPDQCPRPPLSPKSSLPTGHWLEGAALLIQRAK